jgi:hypothetical protein
VPSTLCHSSMADLSHVVPTNPIIQQRLGPYSSFLFRRYSRPYLASASSIGGCFAACIGLQGSAPARQEGTPLPPLLSHRPVGWG